MTGSRMSDAYADWVEEWIAKGFDPYILTFMFNPLGGSQEAIADQMHHIVEGIYSHYLTHIIRRPCAPSARDGLPMWFLTLDLPVYKRKKKKTLRDVSINGGLHPQGFALEPNVRRNRQTLGKHFESREKFYRGRFPGLDRIDVEPITHDVFYVSDYLFKNIHRGRVGDEKILILPRHRSEM